MKISQKTLETYKNFTDEQLKKGAINLTAFGITAIVIGLLFLVLFVPLGIIAILVGVWLLYSSAQTKTIFKMRKSHKEENPTTQDNTVIKVAEEKEITQDNAVTKVAEEKEITNKNSVYYDFDPIIDNSVLCYEYDDNICLCENTFNIASENLGKQLTLLQEPENEYDKKAVAVYLGDNKLGYIYKGNIQKMANDWLNRNDAYSIYISKTDADENKVSFRIGFYKPLDKFESKTFSLTKTSKKINDYETRKDNLQLVDEGDLVYVEYNDETETYTVYTDEYCCSEIGELPASASAFIDDNYCKKVIGIVTEYDKFEDKPKVKVTIYLVK